MLPRDYIPAPGLLQDRVILVTGATGGIGRALALACARHGATVVLHGRRQDALESLYDDIVRQGGPEPAALPLDLATAGSRHYDALAADIDQAVGRLDGIAHCAASTLRLRAAEGISADDFVRTKDKVTGEAKPVVHEAGTFVFRLAGRERQQSASYYTPEVLTRFTVSQALAELLD
jgi:NAD(P)-dependent dehydrogenase (short-subunit alcohol dehydrogenase family)